MTSPIILGYEQYDTDGRGWNFNGRYDANLISLTPEDISQYPKFFQDIYYTIIDPQLYPNNNEILRGCHPVFVQKKQIADIKDEKYLYPIQIYNLPFYIQLTSHIGISPQVRKHILTKQAKIVLILDAEGDTIYHLNGLNELIKKLDLPKEQMIFVHAD